MSNFILPLTTYKPPQTTVKKSKIAEPQINLDTQRIQRVGLNRQFYQNQVMEALKDWYLHMAQKFGPPRLPLVPLAEFKVI